MLNSLTRLLANLFATPSRPSRSARPSLEGLEGRLSPASINPVAALLDANRVDQSADRAIIIAGGKPGQSDRAIVIVGGRTGPSAVAIPIGPYKQAVPGLSIAPQTLAQTAAVDAVFVGR
jgi:hypothetical protein